MVLCGLLVLALARGGVALAQTSEECAECHALQGLGLPGKPLWLGPKDHAAGVHGRLTCSDCHKGVEGYPHAAPQVRCDLPCHVPGMSHEAVAKAESGSVHSWSTGRACGGCHSAGKAPRGAAIEGLCRACHSALDDDRRLLPDGPGALGFWAHRNVSSGRRAPTCADCHGVHGIRKGSAARSSCKNAGCHPGAGEKFAVLFDHRNREPSRAWGGAGPAALLLGAAVAGLLAVHATRRS